MDRDAWRPFLERWSEEWIGAHDPDRDAPLDEEVVRDGWLGFPPARPEEIAASEARLGRALPPSLREFLLVTNGWRNAGNFIYRLAGTTGLGWLRDMDRHWADAYDDVDEYVDGPVLERCLQISLAGDAAVLFLDPDDVDGNGEWAAYWLASWSGTGPERFGSFAELMHDLYRRFHVLRKPESETKRTWDEKVERARLAALAGAVDGPMAVFAEAGSFGRDRADLLRYQLATMLRQEAGLPSSGWSVDSPAPLTDGPLFAAEFLPLLFAQRHGPSREPGAGLQRAMRSDRGRLLVADHQARLREPGYRPRFGVPAFDEAVHRLLAALPRAPSAAALDAAWPELRAAIALWRPLSEDHIAPVVLLSDPVLAEMITPERGREILSTPRGER